MKGQGHRGKCLGPQSILHSEDAASGRARETPQEQHCWPGAAQGLSIECMAHSQGYFLKSLTQLQQGPSQVD